MQQIKLLNRQHFFTLILLFSLCFMFMGCKKEPYLETTNFENIKSYGLDYLEKVKSSSTIKYSQQIDSLLSFIEWGNHFQIDLSSESKIFAVKINNKLNTFNNTFLKKEKRLIFQIRNKKIEYAYILEFIGEYNDRNISQLLSDNLMNYQKNREKSKFYVSHLSLNGNLIVEFEYQNGDLKSSKHISSKPKKESFSGIKSNSTTIKNEILTCKAWYWIVTYYVDGIIVDETSTLLYTTCANQGSGGSQPELPCTAGRSFSDTQNEIKVLCGGGASGPENTEPQEEDLVFLFQDKTPFDIHKLFKCFDNIPNNGATFSIKLCTNIPDITNPTSLHKNLGPGHAFVSVTKQNGAQSITQTFGFYPNDRYLSVSMLGVQSKIVNDGNAAGTHQYNASVTNYNLTESDFQILKETATNLSSRNYDLNNYNCTNYALDVYNSILPPFQKIYVNDWIGLGGNSQIGFNFGTTPNGLYKKLYDMQNGNNNIGIGVFNAQASNGPCN